jgi:hypothetical protein
LLVVFKPEIRDDILIEDPKDRQYFTKTQCELTSGFPLKEGGQDSYDEVMTLADSEVLFWNKINRDPFFMYVEDSLNLVDQGWVDHNRKVVKFQANSVRNEIGTPTTTITTARRGCKSLVAARIEEVIMGAMAASSTITRNTYCETSKNRNVRKIIIGARINLKPNPHLSPVASSIMAFQLSCRPTLMKASGGSSQPRILKVSSIGASRLPIINDKTKAMKGGKIRIFLITFNMGIGVLNLVARKTPKVEQIMKVPG